MDFCHLEMTQWIIQVKCLTAYLFVTADLSTLDYLQMSKCLNNKRVLVQKEQANTKCFHSQYLLYCCTSEGIFIPKSDICGMILSTKVFV